MALTQVSTDGIKNGTITGSDLATNVDLVDNQKLRIGTGNDLQIYHDGSHSYIEDAGTGELRLKSNLIRFQGSNGEPLAIFEEDSAVALYFDNSIKFNTNALGVRFIGHLRGIDNEKIQLGASQDLQLYHDGNHSRIVDSGTGDLKLQTDFLSIVNPGNTETMAKFIENGAVELYHNNSKKFETTSGGIEVSGGANFTSGNISLLDNSKIKLGTGDDLQIYHNGTHSIVQDSGTGKLLLGGDIVEITNAAINEVCLRATENGAVELMHNDSKKFETASNGGKITGSLEIEGGTAQGNHDATLYVTADNNNDWGIIVDAGTGSSGKSEYGLKVVATSGSTYALMVGQVSGNSHVPSFLVNADGDITKVGDITPRGDSSFDLGTTSIRWRNIYADTLYGDGSNLTGVTSVGGSAGVDFNDNVKVRFGNSNDLAIYHDGSNSYIQDSGTGNLIIQATDFRVSGYNTGENIIKGNENGAVELYHNNALKIKTQSFGADIFGLLQIQGNCIPDANNSHDLGTSSARWRNIYTNDLNLSNEGGSNDVDGTWGSYTIQEGAESLYLINKRNGKKYKFNLTEVS